MNRAFLVANVVPIVGKEVLVTSDETSVPEKAVIGNGLIVSLLFT